MPAQGSRARPITVATRLTTRVAGNLTMPALAKPLISAGIAIVIPLSTQRRGRQFSANSFIFRKIVTIFATRNACLHDPFRIEYTSESDGDGIDGTESGFRHRRKARAAGSTRRPGSPVSRVL